MMDEDTITVGYRDWRGEPRGKHRKAIEAEKLGDCIDCYACVNVCPMGIDIRDGQQLACITCALCIDACNDVMDKVDKPRGLIGYVTLADGERERAGGQEVPVWRRIARPRVLLYTALWTGIGVALLAALMLRTDMSMSVEPVRNPINVVLSDGTVRNAYELRLRNMTGYDRDFRLSVVSEDPLSLELQGITGTAVTVPANETLRQRVYLTSPPDSAASREPILDIELVAEDAGSGRQVRQETIFHGRQQ